MQHFYTLHNVLNLQRLVASQILLNLGSASIMGTHTTSVQPVCVYASWHNFYNMTTLYFSIETPQYSVNRNLLDSYFYCLSLSDSMPYLTSVTQTCTKYNIIKFLLGVLCWSHHRIQILHRHSWIEFITLGLLNLGRLGGIIILRLHPENWGSGECLRPKLLLILTA